MEKKRWIQPEKLDLIFTILFLLLTIGGIVLTVYLFRSADQLMQMSGSGLSNMPSGEGVADGYIVIGILLGGGVGFLAGLFAYFIGLLCIAVTIIIGCVTLVSAVYYRKYRDTGNLIFIQRGIRVKIVAHTILLLAILFMTVQTAAASIVILLAFSILIEIALFYASGICREQLHEV